jgi:acetyl esterase
MEHLTNQTADKFKSRRKIISRILIGIVLLIVIVFTAFQVSPWPSVLLIRYAFNKEAIRVNEELEKHIPEEITEYLDLQYDKQDRDSKLDLFHPTELLNSNERRPVIVWIHGGGLISGDKTQVGNYCKILASKGFVVTSIDYTIAPEGKYPTPLIQTNAALNFLKLNAGRFYIDTSNFFLAGDSGGSLIASQVANIIFNSSYAEILSIAPSIQPSQLPGLVLYCGIYEIDNINFEGSFGGFLKTVLWAYSGKKDFQKDTLLKTASILKYVGNEYPSCFISAGNADPLLPHSQALARKLASKNIKVDTVFYPSDFIPQLPHEYQFNLDNDPGKNALEQSVQFIIKTMHNK